MQPAALGLTCKNAFVIFSQNETLRLQQEIQQLKEQLNWACQVMSDAGIQTGCNYANCTLCGNEPALCTCIIRMCQCHECVEDRGFHDMYQVNDFYFLNFGH